MIRIINRQRSKATFFKCSSDEDEDPITIESGDDEAEDEAKNEVEDEVEDKAEERISASKRSQRNIQLPVRYRG